MKVPFHKDLFPFKKPLASQIWAADKLYSTSSVAWYEGMYYVYVVPGKTNQTTGAPTTDTYSMEYTNATDPTSPQTRTERAWVMVQPREGSFGMPAGSLGNVTAATTSANIRGFDMLARQPPNLEVYYYKGLQGTPAYEGNVFYGTSALSDSGSSWANDYDQGQMSKGYGQSDDVKDINDDVIGTRTVKNDYVIPSGQIPQTSYTDRVSNFGRQPFSAFALSNEDNQGWLDARRADTSGDVSNDSIVGKLTQTRSFNVGFPFADYSFLQVIVSPIEATVLSGLLGVKVGYRCVLEYYEYELVTIPPAYIGNPSTQKYYRTGGTLNLVSGDGVNTPRVYSWDPPYDERKQLEVATGEYTMNSSHDAYTEYTNTVVTYNIVDQPWRPIINHVLYNTLNPGQPS